jgi:thiol-disulfide isomerase/thioredoxin
MRMAFAALYIGAAVAANAAAADVAAWEGLREGDMRKLVFLAEPAPVPDTPFEGEDGREMRLSDFAGSVTVVNFWATWCAPCREEMPTLSALAAATEGAGVRVVTIATGRNDPVAMQQFFDEVGATNLPLHRDPRQGLARAMGVMGLPVTVILDAEGREVARLMGDADWNSDSARAILAAVAAAP